MFKQIISAIKISALALILSFGLSYALAAWAPPTQQPPNGNVAAPINVGGTAQTKAGDLTAGSLTTAGLTTTGTLKVTTGAGAAKVLTSDASGNATWQVAAGGSDNLGDHTATQALNMAGFGISGATTVVASDVFSSVSGKWMSTLQSRVSGTCAVGSAVRAVNADGTVTCQTAGSSGGFFSSGKGGYTKYSIYCPRANSVTGACSCPAGSAPVRVGDYCAVMNICDYSTSYKSYSCE